MSIEDDLRDNADFDIHGRSRSLKREAADTITALRAEVEAAARFGEATQDALRAEVERQADIIAALDRTVEELSALVAEHREALAPFARSGDRWIEAVPDEWGLEIISSDEAPFTVGDVRRAAALNKEGE